MATDGVRAPLRILNLALNLINSHYGKSLEELVKTVPGYLPATPETARRTFERDVAHLRDAGLSVELTAEEPPRYRISKSVFGAAPVQLSASEARLLAQAAASWREEDALQLTLLNKLRGYASEPLPVGRQTVAFQLDGGDNLDLLVSAIISKQPVAFEYASKTGVSSRSVAPWRIVTRGRWLYLWGFDLDRWAPRLFRLSRMLGKPRLLGQPGDADPVDELAEVPFDQSAFLVTPVFWARRQEAEHCVSLAQPLGRTEGEWELFRGDEADASTWENYLLREADAVCLVEPKWLAEEVAKHLRIARGWGQRHG